jgi:small subunit ribosomal protein S8
MLNDPLATALTKITNAERVGKKEVLIQPVSSVIKSVLGLMHNAHYIGAIEEVTLNANPALKVSLIGNINRCNVIKPRFPTKCNNFTKWEKRYLPARDFGIIIVSTPKGMVTHTTAKGAGVGGRLIAFCY